MSLPPLGNLSVDALGICDLARLGELWWAHTCVYSLQLGSLGLTSLGLSLIIYQLANCWLGPQGRHEHISFIIYFALVLPLSSRQPTKSQDQKQKCVKPVWRKFKTGTKSLLQQSMSQDWPKFKGWQGSLHLPPDGGSYQEASQKLLVQECMEYQSHFCRQSTQLHHAYSPLKYFLFCASSGLTDCELLKVRHDILCISMFHISWASNEPYNHYHWGHPWWLRSKEPGCQFRRHKFHPLVGEIHWRRNWQPTPVFLPGKFHGQRSLGGYRPWSHERQTWLRDWTCMHALSSLPFSTCLIHSRLCLNSFSTYHLILTTILFIIVALPCVLFPYT